MSTVAQKTNMFFFNGEELKGERVGPDSLLVKNFIGNVLEQNAAAMGQAILSTAPVVDRGDESMFSRGHPLKRVKFFCVRRQAGDMALLGQRPDIIASYNYTGRQWASLNHYRHIESVPALDQLLRDMNSLLIDGQEMGINHVIGTQYITQEDNIGYHNDGGHTIKSYELDGRMVSVKVFDPIIGHIPIMSFGDRREMWLIETEVVKVEKGEYHIAQDKKEASRVDQVIVMEEGDLFLLGPETNKRWKHAIAPVTKERVIKRTEPPATRMSLVLRNIEQMVGKKELEKKLSSSATAKARRQAKK